MRHSIPWLALVLVIFAAGCSDDENPVEPTPALAPKFTATLSPGNEIPAISNPVDAGGSGTVTITFNLARNSSGQITAATADFVVSLAGFPPGTVLTGAHIHQAPAGQSAGVIWNTALASGEVTLTNGSGGFSKLSIPAPTLELPQAIIDNPAGFYFNVHTQANTGGAVRNQLTKVQ